MTKKVYRLAQTLVLPMVICPALSIADGANAENTKGTVAKTAAEIDWRPAEHMSDEQREGTLSYCEGSYVVPSYLPEGTENTSLPPSEVPINASAKSATYDAEQNIHLEGDIEIVQAPHMLTGGSATLNQQTQKAEIGGGVKLRSPGLLLTGSDARYNMATGTFEVDNASYLVHEQGLRGDSETISRPSEQVMVIEGGIITRCDPNDKAWSVAASKIELDNETGVGTAEHVRFRIQDIPVFYFPWMTFPIDDRRKSGFLYPSFGSSNAGSGMNISTPYYFNLAPNYDATLTPQFISGRGLHTELEGRYLNSFGTSILDLGYINEDEEYIKDFPEQDGERWGLSFENNSKLAPGWSSVIDYNVVSDDDYLEDLARTISISNETHIDRMGQVSYAGDVWQFDGIVHGYQTIDSTIAEADKPYSRLPELDLIGEWDNDDFDWALGSQYVYFYRDGEELTGDDKVYGSRLRIKPTLSMPMEQLWGYLTPSIKIDHTDYLLEDRDVEEDHVNRTVPFATLDTGLYFDRPFQVASQNYNQTLEPRLLYVYSPEVGQDDIPDFDSSLKSFNYSQLFSDDRYNGGDRIGDNNRVTLGLTTRFTEDSTGIDRAVFSIGKIYYFEDRVVTLDGEGASTESESPYAGEFKLQPLKGLDLKVTGMWDDQEKKTVEGSSTLSFHTEDYGYVLNLGHRYKKEDDALEQSDISTIFPLTDQISLFGRWLYDKTYTRTAGTLAGIEYRSCCWRAQLLSSSYLKDNDLEQGTLDHTIMFRLELKGLAGFGDSASDLDDQVPGYISRESLYH